MFSLWSVEGRCTFYVCDFLPVVFSWWSVEGQCTVMSATFYQWCSAGEVLKVSVLLCLWLSTSDVQLVNCWRSVSLCGWPGMEGTDANSTGLPSMSATPVHYHQVSSPASPLRCQWDVNKIGVYFFSFFFSSLISFQSCLIICTEMSYTALWDMSDLAAPSSSMNYLWSILLLMRDVWLMTQRRFHVKTFCIFYHCCLSSMQNVHFITPACHLPYFSLVV